MDLMIKLIMCSALILLIVKTIQYTFNSTQDKEHDVPDPLDNYIEDHYDKASKELIVYSTKEDLSDIPDFDQAVIDYLEQIDSEQDNV